MTGFDMLTGIRHRLAFNSCLVNAINAARTTHDSLALVYIDIDDMKHFNLHNGYGVGDILLQRFVALVAPLLNNQRALFRVGGDKFAIILPSGGGEEAVELAHQICILAREALALPQLTHCGDPYCLGPAKIAVSLGVSLLDDTMDAQRFVQSVEKKVAAAKSAGGDQVWI